MRGVMVLRLAQFTQWPGETQPRNRQLVVGMTGGENTGIMLSEEEVDLPGRRFTIRKDIEPANAEECDVLVIQPCAKAELVEVLGRIREKPILTISEMEGFAEHGGMIQFVRRNETVRFIVNVAALESAGLGLSSQVLKLAEIHAGDLP